MYRVLVLIMGVLWSGASLSEALKPKNPDIAWELINNGALIIDVRTPEEFAKGHLDKSKNIPLPFIVAAAKKMEIPKSKSIVMYCRSGRRSGLATEALRRVGYLNVYNGGGFELLKAAKAKTETGK